MNSVENGNIFMRALRDAMQPQEKSENDYVENGLCMCGNCRTPREMRLDILNETMIVPVVCACRKAEIDALEKERLRLKQERIRDLMRQNGFDHAAWRAASFAKDDGRDRRASGCLTRYAQHFADMRENNVGLMLYGGLGCGKTFLAACTANALIDAGYRVMMTGLTALEGKLKAGFGEERERTLQRVRGCDLLILDDVGVERGTEYMVEQVYLIVNERYKAGKPLMITTNLRPEDLKNGAFPEWRRVHDRLIEMCQPVLVHGDSRRIDIARDKRKKCLAIISGEGAVV